MKKSFSICFVLLASLVLLVARPANASGTIVFFDPVWFSTAEMAVATAKGAERIQKSISPKTELYFVGMGGGKNPLDAIQVGAGKPEATYEFFRRLIARNNVSDFGETLKQFRAEHSDLYKEAEHFVVLSPLWYGTREAWKQRALSERSIAAVRRTSKSLQRMIRKSVRKNRKKFVTVILPTTSLEPSSEEVMSRFDGLETLLRKYEIGQAAKKVDQLDRKASTGLMRRKFADMRSKSNGVIQFISRKAINERERLSDQFLEVLCGQLFLMADEIGACSGHERLSVTIRVDFDRALGLADRHLNLFARGLVPSMTTSGPKRSLRSAFLNVHLPAPVNRSPEQYESQLVANHDPRVDYHVRVVAGVVDEPFHRPILYVTAQLSGDVRFRGEIHAPADNTSYQGMLEWLQRDIAAFVEENVASDFPVEKRKLVFRLKSNGKDISAEGYSIFSEVRFNTDQWLRFSNSTVRNQNLVLDVPLRSNAFRLVLDTEVLKSGSGSTIVFQTQRHNLDIKLPRISKNTVQVDLPSKLVKSPTFNLPPEEHEGFDVGKDFRLLVFKAGTSGRQLVTAVPVKLGAGGTIDGPNLLPGLYHFELIPDRPEVLADIGTQTGGNDHVDDIIFESDELASRHYAGNTDFDADFAVDGSGDQEQQKLPSSIRDAANASAVFLPTLLRHSSTQFDKTGDFESLRPLWSQLRGYLFGAGARSARHRLVRTMGSSGLLSSNSSEVREDAFDLVWAMFDWAVTQKSVRYLSDIDHRLSYNAWIENMIDREGQKGLFGRKFAAFLKVK
ncbi:MAG: hypothetical protein HOG12_18590 [Alphaproteobacteria bacterium]|jgi:hypothetical protein|nr:hypothetical protein [Alphaproteobacteria bacterium]